MKHSLLKSLYGLTFLLGISISFNANAWFFFFIPGGAIQAVGDAFTGAKGNICVKDTYKEGDVIPSTVTSNTAKILSLSGTSSICQNPTFPIRAEVEFTYNHTSKAGIDIPDDYEAQAVSDIDRFNGRLLLAKSKIVGDKYIMISSMGKRPDLDMETMANNIEKSQISLLKDANSTNPERLKINGLNALRFEVVGTTKSAFGIDRTFFITLIDAGNEVIYINEWCRTGFFPDAKPEFISVVNSIKGLEGEPINDGFRASPTKQAMPAKASTKSSALTSTAAPMPVISSGSPSDKLETLNSMLKKGLITQQDYDFKKAEILKSM
jgi:hypothetical protein